MTIRTILRRVAIKAAAVLLLASPLSAATYAPFGPQNDVTKTDVTSGGWTLVYSGGMDQTVPYSTAFAGLLDWVLIAAAPVGSATFDLLGSIRTADFEALPTVLNATETHNGAGWYRNGYSLGFAPAGATIQQASADIEESSVNATVPTGPGTDQRMSWHTDYFANEAPVELDGGWRSGENLYLNSASTWERFVFTASDASLGIIAPVPLPAAGWMLLMGLGGMALLRRRSVA